MAKKQIKKPSTNSKEKQLKRNLLILAESKRKAKNLFTQDEDTGLFNYDVNMSNDLREAVLKYNKEILADEKRKENILSRLHEIENELKEAALIEDPAESLRVMEALIKEDEKLMSNFSSSGIKEKLKAIQNHPDNVNLSSARDSTFIEEAQNVADFYKNNTDVNVDILPFYTEDSTKVFNSIADLKKGDDLAIFGHSGSKLGGIDNKRLAESIKDSEASNCYLGSCEFEDKVSDFEGTGKQTYYRPDGPWLGFNKHSDNFIEGMFSRNITGYDEVYDHVIRKPKEGEDYKVVPAKEFQKGGKVEPQGLKSDIKKEYIEYKKGGMVKTRKLPEYGLGGDIFGGLSSGAGAAASLAMLGAGPVGMIAGGLGMLGAAIGSGIKKRRTEKKAMAQEKEDRRLSGIRQSRMASLEPQQHYQTPFTYEDGGNVGVLQPQRTFDTVGSQQGGRMVPVNVEAGENMVDPRGGQYQVPDNAPTHAQGGVDMLAEEDTRVFSNDLEKEGTGKTYAELNKPYVKTIKKSQKVLKNPNATAIAKKTAQKNLDNVGQFQHELFVNQEQYKFRKGIRKEEKEGAMYAQTGGLVEELFPQLKMASAWPSKLKMMRKNSKSDEYDLDQVVGHYAGPDGKVGVTLRDLMALPTEDRRSLGLIDFIGEGPAELPAGITSGTAPTAQDTALLADLQRQSLMAQLDEIEQNVADRVAEGTLKDFDPSTGEALNTVDNFRQRQSQLRDAINNLPDDRMVRMYEQMQSIPELQVDPNLSINYMMENFGAIPGELPWQSNIAQEPVPGQVNDVLDTPGATFPDLGEELEITDSPVGGVTEGYRGDIPSIRYGNTWQEPDVPETALPGGVPTTDVTNNPVAAVDAGQPVVRPEYSPGYEAPLGQEPWMSSDYAPIQGGAVDNFDMQAEPWMANMYGQQPAAVANTAVSTDAVPGTNADMDLGTDDFGMTTEPWMSQQYGVHSVDTSDFDNLDYTADLPGDVYPGSAAQGAQGAGFQSALGVIGGLAPALYNVGRGLFGKPEVVDPNEFRNVAGLQAASNLRNRRYNIRPQLDALRRSYAQGKRDIASVARTPGQLAAMTGAAATRRGQAESALYANKQMQEDAYRAQADQAMLGIGAQQAGTNLQVADMNTRARAAQNQMLGTGLSQLSSLAQRAQRNKALEEMDENLRGLLGVIAPSYYS